MRQENIIRCSCGCHFLAVGYDDEMGMIEFVGYRAADAPLWNRAKAAWALLWGKETCAYDFLVEHRNAALLLAATLADAAVAMETKEERAA